jgi:hypothetical protein
MSEWQKIDSAPRDGTGVLLSDGKNIEVGSWDEGYTHGWGSTRGNWLNPTHWMPLPNPPSDE